MRKTTEATLGVAGLIAAAAVYATGGTLFGDLDTPTPPTTSAQAPAPVDTNPPLPARGTPSEGDSPVGTARSQLADMDTSGLLNQPETSGDDYDRDEWGYGDPLNGECNARALLLTAESHGPVDTNDNCTVTGGGPWTGYYTGQTYTDPQDVEIEHVVPLEEAERSGADEWSTDRKQEFANGWDTNRLRVADGGLNGEHSSDDPAKWMPPNNQCRYLVDWIDIKHEFDLSMDTAETTAVRNGLDTHC